MGASADMRYNEATGEWLCIIPSNVLLSTAEMERLRILSYERMDRQLRGAGHIQPAAMAKMRAILERFKVMPVGEIKFIPDASDPRTDLVMVRDPREAHPLSGPKRPRVLLPGA